MNKRLMSFDEFWQVLEDKGYQYGFDAADNAYMGYKFAHELEEETVVRVVVKDIVRGIANDYAASGFNSLSIELKALIGE